MMTSLGLSKRAAVVDNTIRASAGDRVFMVINYVLLTIILLMLFPQIALWLPSLYSGRAM